MKTIRILSLLTLLVTTSASFADTKIKALSCTNQKGSRASENFVGYDFDLETGHFQNQVSLGQGQIFQVEDFTFKFLEGSVEFNESYELATFRTESTRFNQPIYKLTCKQKKTEPTLIGNLNFALISEDIIDGEMKSNLNFLNYCGNQAAVLNIDISKYVKSGAPGAARKTSIYGRREQFGPVVDCLPGERRRENFKVINQLLNEARENNFLMPAKLSIRREQFAPGGYAIKFELYSKKLNKTFLFFDNLNANYSIE